MTFYLKSDTCIKAAGTSGLTQLKINNEWRKKVRCNPRLHN
jgi:hypothetical protein